MRVPVYRVYANPLSGIASIPESQFRGRENTLFAFEIDVEVFGDNFLPAYTHGDNSQVVATDSMKNFILRQALTFKGATLEELLEELGCLSSDGALTDQWERVAFYCDARTAARNTLIWPKPCPFQQIPQ